MTEKTETATLSSDATEVRAQKLKLLREQIGDVYPAHFHRTLTNAELAAKYEGLEPDVETQDVVTVARPLVRRPLTDGRLAVGEGGYAGVVDGGRGGRVGCHGVSLRVRTARAWRHDIQGRVAKDAWR